VANGSFVFQTISVPGAAGGTRLGGINNGGTISGDYTVGYPGNPYPQSFTEANGTVTNLGADRGIQQATGSINNSGQVAGTTGDAISGVDGFLWTAGSEQLISSGPTFGQLTKAFGVNDGGVVVGSHRNTATSDPAVAFTWQTGTMTFFQAPGATTTEAHGINNGGTIVGTADSQGFEDIGGQFAPIAVPGATITDPMAINTGGTIAGSYNDGVHWHGFVDAAGQVTTVDAPGAADTWITGENDAGTLVGYFDTVTNGVVQSFIATDPPVTPPPATPPAPALSVLDTTTGQAMPATAQPYNGPVAGLQEQYVNITSDNLNMSVSTPNWFLHSGSGTDAIAANSGTNVMDGGTGSNFLTGGSGTDTFFVDDRAASSDIWSTVVGFHAGDAATVWGVTPQDFSLSWDDGQGASGFTGLTLHATSGGRPTASLTLAGYSSADIGGRLAVSFGSVDGNAYMYIHGNG